MHTLTIITITYNNLAELKKTIRSFQRQTSHNKKIIVVDGDSNDGTKDWLKECNIPQLTYISEKDSGISDAFNKGIKAANSKWVCFLNSGDFFVNDNDLDVIERDISKVDDKNTFVVTYQAITSPTNKTFPANVELATPESRSMISHQASMIRRDAFELFGYFDLKFTLRMDYELFLRFFKTTSPHFIARPIILYDVKGRSSKLSNRPRFILEGIIAEYLVLKKSNWYCIKKLYLIPKDICKKILSYSYYRIRYNIDLF